MKVTETTRRVRAYREAEVALLAEGFILISEDGSPLWRFQRGDWTGRTIAEARVGPNGKEVWIKLKGIAP